MIVIASPSKTHYIPVHVYWLIREFDNVDVEEPDTGMSPEGESTPSCEEYSLSCLFTLPSSAEELNQRVDTQMIELETIELLPGTTTIRGTIRVANLCYAKAVYVRMSLDLWASYSDLAAEYVPGSSDRRTDRFTFTYTVVPPSDRDGARVEICLRYETPVGTFWANNNDINYVLFCYKKVNTSERASKAHKEGGTYIGKRSCLRPGRRASIEEKTRETSYTTAFAEAEAANKNEEANRKTISKAEMQSLVSHKENKPLVDSLKGRRKHTRLAHAQDYFSQRSQRSPRPSSHDSASGQEFHQPLPNVQRDPCNCVNKQQKIQSRESPKVLTYHEIPLLTLDWNSDKAHQWGAAGKGGLWPRTTTASPAAHVDDGPPVMDVWETFLNGTDDAASQETSVCQTWQTFLNQSGCSKLSAVPESEWLQRAASVSPSDDKKSLAKSAMDGKGHELQTVVDAVAASHMGTRQCVWEGPLAKITANPSDQYTAKAQREESATSTDLPQRSGMNPPTGIPEKFNATGETAASEDSVQSSTVRQKRATGEQEEEEMREGVEGKDDEPLAPPTADSVTSSGEQEPTDLTSLSETQNGSAVDRISQGASADEGLSFSGEGQVAGTSHNETDDTLAFTGTIRRGTEAEGLFVFSTSTQGVEKGNGDSCAKSTREEIFMPREKAECEISQRFERDETQHAQLRPCQSGGNLSEGNDGDGNEVRSVQSNADQFGLNKTCHDNFVQVEIEGTTFKSEIDVAGSVNLASDKMVEAEFSNGTSKGSLIGGEDRTILEFNEDEKQSSVNSLQPLQRDENISKVYGACNQQLKQIRSREELQIQDDQEASEATPRQEGTRLNCEAGKGGLVFDETEEGKCLISHTWGSREMQEVSRGDNDTFRPFPNSKCDPSATAAAETRWVHTQDNMKAEKWDIGRQISPQEVAEEIDTSGELQRQPETPKRTEGDKSHRSNNEKPSAGELKIEAPGDLTGDTGIPRGKGESVPTQFKEQEQPAGVKSSPHVESVKLSAGTKDPIMAGSAMALEVTEATLEEMDVQRFGEDLVRAIWGEVFNLKVSGTHGDLKAVDEMAAFFALYMFSMSWWFYKLKGHQVTTAKGKDG
ncbi:uncharacterized protein ppp1r3aa [Nelusetta ayraudi]|uniref:uncharacterized protein ppp1r3aa n=1 Tax=Nelusetta ayraudi TaxID=303726 RepID=UPI003F71E2C9